MRECLASIASSQDRSILTEVVQFPAFLDRRVIVESNNDGGKPLTVLMARLVGVPFNVCVAVRNALHVADLDSLERNGIPHNFAVKIKQRIEFILDEVEQKKIN